MRRRFTCCYWRDNRNAALGIVCLLFALWRWSEVNGVQSGPQRLEEGFHKVDTVLDGDTVLLGSGARVRLQAIHVPDSVRMDAKRFLQERLLTAAGRVRLTFALERQDDQGCFLAYVWHGETLLNEELLRAGLAEARLDYRSSGQMIRRFAAAQDEARSAGQGVWSNKVASSSGL